MKKRSKIIFFLPMLMILGSIISTPLIGFAGGDLFEKESRKQLKKSEDQFKAEPSIHEGAIIVNTSYFLKEYEKAIRYAELCIKMGANETSYGHLINLWLAASLNKVGQVQDAKMHLKKAIELDKNGIFGKTNAIKKFELQELLIKMDEKNESSL